MVGSRRKKIFRLVVSFAVTVLLIANRERFGIKGNEDLIDFSTNRDIFRVYEEQIKEFTHIQGDISKIACQELDETQGFSDLVEKISEIEEREFGFCIDEKLHSLREDKEVLFETMVRNGDPLAIRIFSQRLISMNEYEGAISLLEDSAIKGDPRSMKLLSNLYTYQMPRVLQDKNEGAKWDYLAEYFWNNELGKTTLLETWYDYSPMYIQNNGYSEDEKKKGLELAKEWIQKHELSINNKIKIYL